MTSVDKNSSQWQILLGAVSLLAALLLSSCLPTSHSSTFTPLPPTPTLQPPPPAPKSSTIPSANPYDLACRLKGICGIPTAVPSGPFDIGARKNFWVTDATTNRSLTVSAILRYRTAHAYFWIQEEINYSPQALENLAETFESRIYPTTRTFFGEEWTPGVDGDLRLHILYTRGLGAGIAGYFSAADEINPLIHPHSNGHELFFISAEALSLSSPALPSTLAHEFQHMIHWNLDRNEDTWLNEGLGVLSEDLNGYAVNGVSAFIFSPDLNLTGWGNDAADSIAHYMQAYLFLAYILDRFGPALLQAIVRSPQNGLESIDETLQQHQISDPLRQRLLTADDLFLDWAAALYLLNPALADGRYGYTRPRLSFTSPATETISTCPLEAQQRTVEQYGIDYIAITCPGRYRLTFRGQETTSRFPTAPHSGDFMFWSNEGNLSNMRLTRRFDLTHAAAPLTLTYWTWFDLEQSYDYLYLEASVDGQNWQILQTPSSSAENPVGNSYGYAYNGESNGWIEETVDLSAFAGQQVWLRFEYVTDDAITGAGFFLDDLSLPAIGYATDFEQDDGGWQAEGFERIQNHINQTFRILWIQRNASTTTVRELPLSPAQQTTLDFSLAPDETATLVVTATSRLTHLPANYTFAIHTLPTNAP